MRTSLLVGIGIGFFCLMILYSFGAPDVLGAQERFIIKGAEVSKPVKPTRIQRDLRTVPPTVPWRPGDPVSEEPRALSPSFELVPITPEIVPAPPDGKEERSSALRGPGKIPRFPRRHPRIPWFFMQETPEMFSEAYPNFEGISFAGSWPPDTVGDVGPNHYVQAVNGGGALDTQLQIFNKQGNSLAGPFSTNAALWSLLPDGSLCKTEPLTDPIVLYDHLADRWFFGEFARTPPVEWGICIAVSQGPDPVSDGWFVYEFAVTNVPDYLKFGVWPDGYYMSSQRGFPDDGLDVWVFDRTNMLNGLAANRQTIFIDTDSLILLPSDLDGPPPPAGTPNFFARHVDGDVWGGSDRVEIYEFSVDWADETQTTFTGPTSLLTAPFDANLCFDASLGDTCVPQPGTAQKLDTIPHWPMWRLQYRNLDTHEALVFNHTVDADSTGHAGIRWYELRRTGGGAWTIFQQGTHSPDEGAPGLADDVHRWMGSIAMDKAGNMALGYSVSSDTVFPSIRYAGRLITDPPGELLHGEFSLVSGTNSQTGTERWGDYSSMNVDPVDNCTFWYTQEYIGDSGNWRTRIGAFSFPSCFQADLDISKSDSPDPVTTGEQLTYTLTVTNNGPDRAIGVRVVDTLPSAVFYQSDNAGCTEAAGTVTCDLGEILPADTRQVVITVLVDISAPNLIINTATVDTVEGSTDPDPGNNMDSESTAVNRPPVAICQDVTVPAELGLCSAEASVDGGSYDPDGDPITLVQSPPGPYPVGSTLVTLTVTDDNGASSSCSATVTVVDTQPPIINTVTANPDVLWPPNHKMVPVSVNVSTSDNCGGPATCQIVWVNSNEPENGIGDGNTAPDWIITGDLTLKLRAERSGTGDGRIYTITVSCADSSGNSTWGDVTVSVPHDQGKKK